MIVNLKEKGVSTGQLSVSTRKKGVITWQLSVSTRKKGVSTWQLNVNYNRLNLAVECQLNQLSITVS